MKIVPNVTRPGYRLTEKGFTLVELLIVVIILAILLVLFILFLAFEGSGYGGGIFYGGGIGGGSLGGLLPAVVLGFDRVDPLDDFGVPLLVPRRGGMDAVPD